MDNESLRSEDSFVTLSANNNGPVDQDKTSESDKFQDPQRFIDRLRANFAPPSSNGISRANPAHVEKKCLSDCAANSDYGAATTMVK